MLKILLKICILASSFMYVAFLKIRMQLLEEESFYVTKLGGVWDFDWVFPSPVLIFGELESDCSTLLKYCCHSSLPNTAT